MTRRLVGVDAGGTYTKICLVAPGGGLVSSVQIPTDVSSGPRDFVRRVSDVVKRWKFDAMGLALAGSVEPASGALVFAPNLKGWLGFPFRPAFQKRHRTPVVVENDANAAVWGGYVLALGRKSRHVIGLTLGTGVGGGLIVDGRLHHGASRCAGEVGHMTLSVRGPLCACGKRGCLESYAGTGGILRAARRLMRKPPRPLTPKAVAEAAAVGDPGARRVWEEVGGWLGLGVANLVLAFNPDAVLLLGGVARAGRFILDPVRRALDAQPFREPFERVILRAPAGRDWGCVGAALLGREAR